MSVSKEDDLFSGRLTDGSVNLTVGAPGPKSLQASAGIFDAASEHCRQKILDKSDASLFQYGPVSGHKSYLDQLALFLSDEYKDKVFPDSLTLTCGATHGLHLIATTLLHAGPEAIIFVENPTYFIAMSILRQDLNFKIMSVPLEDDGVDTEALEVAVRDAYNKLDGSIRRHGRFWGMFYTIPTFHNPTGALTSIAKCQKVIELARKYELLVVCDDVYNLLYYEGEVSPKRLLAYDNPSDANYNGGCVASNATFSKILAPGIRVGWIESGPRIHDMLRQSGVLSSGGSVNNVMSGIIASALQLGLQTDHVQHLRQLYRERFQAIGHVLKLPEGFSCRLPAGGYFFWIVGPLDFDAKLFSIFCRDQFAVHILPGIACNPDPENSISCSNCFRLSIAFYEVDELVVGVQRVCQALSAWIIRQEQP